MHDLVIIGAGPAGLAAAIAARRAGLDFRIFEKGVLVNALFHFPSQMVFFTTPDLLEIGGLPFVTPHGKPTRDETLRYYRRVVDACGLDIAFGYRVTAVVRRTRPRAGSRSPRRTGRGRTRRGGHVPSSSQPAATTIPTGSESPAKTCPTSPTTTPSRTSSTGGASSW